MKQLRHALTVSAVVAALVLTPQPLLAQSRDADPATRAANDAFAKTLPFSDRADFDDAWRGFIGTLPDGVIAGPGGRPAFDTRPYAFLQKDEAPATVNPSLWRQAQLNAVNGLFKVTERVYQVRGLDIANMTIIEG
jgi:alkyl sulfatase BDS1-like metallo-beta-lactamase superfamily hydrolase